MPEPLETPEAVDTTTPPIEEPAAYAEPEPVVSAASQVPPRPAQERPAWSSPPQPEQPGGALAVIKERPAVVIAAVVATVLFLIIRRLR